MNKSDKFKLFSKFSVLPLIIGIIGMFISLQNLGVYLFTPLVFKDKQLTTQQIFELGSLNGTVTSYAFLFTLVTLLMTIIGLIKWRIYAVQRMNEEEQDVFLLSKTVNVTAHELDIHNDLVDENEQIKRLSVINYLAIKPFSIKIGLIVLGMWVLFLIGSEGFSRLFYRDPTAFMDVLYMSAKPKWLLILVVVVAAPLYEELIFRGILWRALREQVAGKRGVWLASIVTSLLFAVIHFQYEMYELIVIFILALLLSYARARSGSLWLPIIIHIINNGLTMWVYIVT